MFSCSQRIENMAPKFAIFSSVFFSGRIILKACSCSPQKIFENLHTVVAILVLFEQFLGKFWLHFVPLHLNVSLSMMHFVRTFSIMCA